MHDQQKLMLKTDKMLVMRAKTETTCVSAFVQYSDIWKIDSQLKETEKYQIYRLFLKYQLEKPH